MSSPEELEKMLSKVAKILAKDIARENLKGKSIVLKLKTSDFEQFTRCLSLSRYISEEKDLYNNGRKILYEYIRKNPNQSYRLMGLRLSSFYNEKDQDASLDKFVSTIKTDNMVKTLDKQEREKIKKYQCPVCNKTIETDLLKEFEFHVDQCLQIQEEGGEEEEEKENVEKEKIKDEENIIIKNYEQYEKENNSKDNIFNNIENENNSDEGQKNRKMKNVSSTILKYVNKNINLLEKKIEKNKDSNIKINNKNDTTNNDIISSKKNLLNIKEKEEYEYSLNNKKKIDSYEEILNDNKIIEKKKRKVEDNEMNDQNIYFSKKLKKEELFEVDFMDSDINSDDDDDNDDDDDFEFLNNNDDFDLNNNIDNNIMKYELNENASNTSNNSNIFENNINHEKIKDKDKVIKCPVCGLLISCSTYTEINQHIDLCLNNELLEKIENTKKTSYSSTSSSSTLTSTTNQNYIPTKRNDSIQNKSTITNPVSTNKHSTSILKKEKLLKKNNSTKKRIRKNEKIIIMPKENKLIESKKENKMTTTLLHYYQKK